MKDRLTLKFGTWKSMDLHSDKAIAAKVAYFASGEQALSTMQHHDTTEQIERLCDLIDAIDGEIHNDWTGQTMTKDEAKLYIREYRR